MPSSCVLLFFLKKARDFLIAFLTLNNFLSNLSPKVMPSVESIQTLTKMALASAPSTVTMTDALRASMETSLFQIVLPQSSAAGSGGW